MAMPAEKARYTFADCLTWEENERIEIINGEAVMMALPSRTHQEISGAMFAQLYNFLEGKNAGCMRPRSLSSSSIGTGRPRKTLTQWSSLTCPLCATETNWTI